MELEEENHKPIAAMVDVHLKDFLIDTLSSRVGRFRDVMFFGPSFREERQLADAMMALSMMSPEAPLKTLPMGLVLLKERLAGGEQFKLISLDSFSLQMEEVGIEKVVANFIADHAPPPVPITALPKMDPVTVKSREPAYVKLNRTGHKPRKY